MFNAKNNKYSTICFYFIVLFSFCCTPFFVNWQIVHHPFTMDVDQYYSYLNAAFIQHDLTFKTNTHSYWLIETPTHQLVPKVTYGVSLFYTPFYVLAKAFSSNNSTGYEPIYAWVIHFGCITYILTGLYFIKKTLLIWFNEIITAISILILFFGTNLFYYTLSESESVHGILFFLVSIFVYYVVHWHLTASKKCYYIFIFIAGFICLIRPTEVVLFVIPLLMGVVSVKTLKDMYIRIISLKWHLLVGLIVFLIPIMPQLFFWKMQSGQWLFFSYGNTEHFFFLDPKIINVLFSYRKGLFVYTPLLLLSVIGFIFLYRNNKKLFYAIFTYFIINLYLISSWWDWAYGASFGMRALIQAYSVLIIPLAYCIEWVIRKNKNKIIQYAFYIVVVFLSVLNVFQSNLYKHGIIDYDGMTKKAYWFTFFKKEYTNDDLIYLKTLVKHPDYNNLRSGQRDE